MENKPKKYKPTGKLNMDPTNKQRYFIFYRDTKFYIKHGTRVLKKHIVHRFKQSPWLVTRKSYENFTEQTIKAKPEFEKHIYKIMKYSFYGTTIENIRKLLHLDLIDKSETHRILN